MEGLINPLKEERYNFLTCFKFLCNNILDTCPIFFNKLCETFLYVTLFQTQKYFISNMTENANIW